MMSITAFGSVFLPLVLFVVLFRRAWIFPLLCISAVMQSPSVVNIDWSGVLLGISPFVAAAALFIPAQYLNSGERIGIGPGRERWWLTGIWSVFSVVCLVGAFSLPELMGGLMVLSPLDKSGVHTSTVSLAWTVSNLAQSINLLLLVGVGVLLSTFQARGELRRGFLIGVVLALGISALVGLQQRLAWNGLVPMAESFWASNPTYAQNFESNAGPIARVSWPFVEASYASAWFAAVFGGFVTMFMADVHRHKALLGMMVSLFALGNTLGATGLLAALASIVVVGGVVLVGIVAFPRLRGGLFYRSILGAIACTCVALGSYLVLRHQGLLELFQQALPNVLQGRSETMLGDLRPHADRHAMRLLWETWGLGVGMGSNRASSYLAGLASNVGIPGLVLFLTAVGLQFYLLAKRILRKPDAPSVFFFGSGIAALIAVSIAIPDQNWPVLWMLLLGGFACVVSSDEQGGAAAEVADPAGHGELHDRAV